MYFNCKMLYSKMKSRLLKVLFSMSSFSWVVLFLLVNSNFNIPYFSIPLNWYSYLWEIPIYFLKYICIVIFTVFLSWFVLWLTKKLMKSEGWIKNIKTVKPMEWQFMPVYIWLFVVALSFNNFSISTLFLIFILFILQLTFETVSYFNPFMILLWYRFYEIETDNNIVSIIITKTKDIKKIKEFKTLVRLNNFTFLEYGNEKSDS